MSNSNGVVGVRRSVTRWKVVLPPHHPFHQVLVSSTARTSELFDSGRWDVVRAVPYPPQLSKDNPACLSQGYYRVEEPSHVWAFDGDRIEVLVPKQELFHVNCKNGEFFCLTLAAKPEYPSLGYVGAVDDGVAGQV